VHFRRCIVAVSRFGHGPRRGFTGTHLTALVSKPVTIPIDVPRQDNPLAIVHQVVAIVIDLVADLESRRVNRVGAIVAVLSIFDHPRRCLAGSDRRCGVPVAIAIGVGVPDAFLDIRIFVITVLGSLYTVLIDIPALRVFVR
jgi:hypothetical protein